MGKTNNINYLSVATQDLRQVAGPQSQVTTTADVSIVLNGDASKRLYVREGQVYQLAEPRLILVTKGTAEVNLNLEHCSLGPGKVVLTTPDMILEPIRFDAGISISGIVFKDDIHVGESIVADLSPRDFGQMVRMLYLLHDVATQEPYRRDTVRQLVTAMISNLSYIKDAAAGDDAAPAATRAQQLFQQFKTLVNKHCTEERNIPFYARRLSVSPHHLSAVVSHASGHSVMYWLNRAVLLRAKVLLRNSDLMTYEIAYRLHFNNPPAFNNFFKRETGMTPKAYRCNTDGRAGSVYTSAISP